MTKRLLPELGSNGLRLMAAVMVAIGTIAHVGTPEGPPKNEAKQAARPQPPEFDKSWLQMAAADMPVFKDKPRPARLAYWSADDVAIPAGGLSKEANCLATAIYFEARGEPVKGQKAVAEVVMTRAGSGRYPGSICGVVYQNSDRFLSCQFTFTCDGKVDRPRDPVAWNLARRIAVAALVKARNKRPITRWATHYHATYVNPRWASKLRKTTAIGTHIFYREG